MYGKHQSLLILLLAALLGGAAPCFGDSGISIALLERVQFWRSLGRNDLAGQALKKALRTAPNDPDGLALQAYLALDLDRRTAAEELLQQLQQQHPEAPQTRALEQMLEITGPGRTQLREARLAARLGKSKEALQIFRKLFAGTPLPSPLALEYWKLLGWQATHQEEAIQGLESLVQTYPGNLRYRMALARQLARKDPSPPESIETFIELSQYSPLRREARSAWRNAVLALKAEHESLQALRQYLEQDPKDSGVAQRIREIESAAIAKKQRDRDPVHAGLLRGIAFLEKGDLDAATPLLKSAAKKWPGEVLPVGAMGRLRLKQARYREAVSWFQRALALEPDNAGKWRSLLQAANYWGLIKQAKSAMQRDDLDRANTILRKAVAIDGQEAYGIALLAQIQSQWKEAEQLYRQALAIDPQSSTALRGLVNLYADNQRLDDASTLLDSLNPAQQQALGNSYAALRASLLREQADQLNENGAPEAAITALRRAIDLDPENPWLRFDLTDLLLDGNEARQAVEVFEAGLRLAPQDPQMRYAYALLLSRLDRETDAMAILDELPADQLPPNIQAYRNRLHHDQRIRKALVLAEQGEHSRAREMLQQLQKRFSEDANAQLEIAAAWRAIGSSQLAMPLLLQLAKHSELSTAQRQRRQELEIASVLDQAELLATAGKHHQALELLEAARRRIGPEPVLIHRTAQLHGSTGNHAAALAHYQELVAKETAFAYIQDEDEQWLHWSRTEADPGLRQEVAGLLQQQSPKFLSGLHMGFRNATEGLSSLESYELPMEARWSLHKGQMFAHVAPVRLDAGKLNLDKSGIRSRFGTGALCLQNCTVSPLSQLEQGTTLAIGYRGLTWRADVGSSPLGFPVSHLLGGVEIDGDLLDAGWSLELSRRPVTSTLLSYAGMKDAETGKTWGGVVTTGIDLGLSWDQGGSYGLWGSFGIHALRGKRVADNLRLRALGGVYWRWLNQKNTQLRGGINLMSMHFDKNLEEFTLGHGGYYSPQSYVSLSLPISFFGRRDRWSWELRSSISYSVSRFDRSPYFPDDPGLQDEAERLETITGITPYYDSDTSSGAGYAFNAAVEYRVNPYLHVGAKAKIERADSYAPDHFLLYFRYSARPRLNPMPLYPHPTMPYSDF